MHSLMRGFFFRTAAVILGIVCALTIAELGIRVICPQPTGPVQFVFNPVLGQMPLPRQKARRVIPQSYDYTYSNNSHGLRGSREYQESKTGKFRILVLGDSFVYGVGVNDDQTFCAVIEKKLLRSGLDVEVINAGIGGKGTSFALRFFQVLGYKFKPDLVILCFVPNDFEDNLKGEYFDIGADDKLSPKLFQGTLSAEKKYVQRVPFYSWLISWSHVVNLFKQTVIGFIYQRRVFPKRHDWEDPEPSQYDLRPTRIFMSELKREVQDSGAGYLVFYIPFPKHLLFYRKTHTLTNREKDISGILVSLGQPLFSLTPFFAEARIGIYDLYYRNDEHLTVAGNSLAADLMSRRIVEYMNANYYGTGLKKYIRREQGENGR